MKRIVLPAAALLVALLAAGAFHLYGPRRTPGGQPPLVRLDPSSFHRLQEAFDMARDSTRVLLLFSPT